MTLSTFKKTIWDYYAREGRLALPWRKTRNPYRVMVSEFMLQQTQVSRVLIKYQEFLQKFPTIQVLAQAPLSKVLQCWSGLGYNRRAKFLHEASKVIMNEHGKKIPRDIDALQRLPGIGRATACCIAAFAFNEPHVFIETNIRSIYIHHFFPHRRKVSDEELLPIIERTLDQRNPREWYWALMDYGTSLKSLHVNPSRKSKSHVTQSSFDGSNRQIRGAIIRIGTQKRTWSEHDIVTRTKFDAARIRQNLEKLKKEGMLIQKRGTFTLTS